MTFPIPDAEGSATEAGTRDGEAAAGEPLERGESRPLQSLVLGLKGGAYATVVMTAFRMPISSSLPPTANFWAHYFGDDPEDHPVPAFVLHLVYGVLGGGVFGLLYDRRVGQTRAGMELADIARGIVYSLVFSVFGSRIVLSRVVGMDLETDEALVFHVGHAIYGIALGAWVGSNR